MTDPEWDIKVTSKGQITIPKQARDFMMIREGDHLQAIMKDDSLVLTKKLEMSDAEHMRLAAERILRELSHGRKVPDRRRLREEIGAAHPDLTQLVREGRERQ